MSLDRGQITDKIIGIINEVRHSSESISEKDYDIPLLGDHFGMDYQDLVFIFLELMEEFKIRFTCLTFLIRSAQRRLNRHRQQLI